ncbi:RDD family protein [Mycobacterium sp. Marseille-P9652]|uniref:RDD family protein n=1 Tax=Mycobacterium sp. Marseille-P9652 TaxID=2654950 RepID=UPI0012E94342|nr:RDD family protein [Mycobacterium sp. Marseille-P9652]
MTVVVEETQTTAVPESAPNALAPWHVRAGALAVDVLPGVAVVATSALVALSLPQHPVWWWVSVSIGGLTILLMLVNRLLLPTVTGWSLGRALFGVSVVRHDGSVPAPWWLLLRDLAHLLDTLSVVGWLWPLWDSQRRTFADMLLGTEARRVGPDAERPDARRWTLVAVASATALCLGGAAVSFLVVYSYDRDTQHTKAEIAVQGPKIVAQMLTYDPKSLADDFARARSLATDKYRSQLATQQDVVQKGNPVINEYWPINSSILTAGPDRATMLVFLQGRRGSAPDERYITATVRVAFLQGGDHHWRVDDLAVLTKPKPPGNGK